MTRVLLVVALVTTACSGGGSAEPVASTEATASADVDGADVPSTTSPAPTTTTPTTTTAAPTTSTSTTTTLPPNPKATVSRLPVPSLRQADRLDGVSDVAVVAGDTPVALLGGSASDGPGERRRAMIASTSDGSEITRQLLDDGGAVESAAFGIAVEGDIAAVTGTITDTDGVRRVALWESADRGATFGPAEFPLDGPGLGDDVIVADGSVVLFAWQADDKNHALVSIRRDGTNWVSTPVPTSDESGAVSGAVVAAGALIVTGTVQRDGRSIGTAWVSTDGGATFVESAEPLLAERTAISAPIAGGDGVMASAARPGNGSTSLITSADGMTWRTIELDVTNPRGEPWAASAAGASPLIAFAGGYALGVTSQLSAVATVDANGSGSFLFAPYLRNEKFDSPIPFALGDRLHVVGRSARSYRIATFDPGAGDWNVTGEPPDGSRGSEVSSVALYETSTGPAAIARTFPHTTPSASGGIQWQQSELWSVRDNDGWAVAPGETVPVDASQIATTGELDVALDPTAFDPGDDELAGPIGATTARLRTADGGWSDPEIVLTGPGADYSRDVEALGDGFVAVGTRYVRDAAGIDSETVVITEYRDGTWTEAPVEAELGSLSSLSRVAVVRDDLALATGSTFTGDRSTPLALSRGSDGVWRSVQLPAETADLQVWSVTTGQNTIDMLLKEGDDWFRATTADGTTFDRQPVVFEEPTRSFPISLATIGDITYLVGTRTTLGAATLAIWELEPDGVTTLVELDEPQVSVDLDIDSALVVDDRLLIGGVWLGESVIWEIKPAG